MYKVTNALTGDTHIKRKQKDIAELLEVTPSMVNQIIKHKFGEWHEWRIEKVNPHYDYI